MKKIMFNDKYDLTKAVLEGRKTQTRRICEHQFWSFSERVDANSNHYFPGIKMPFKEGEEVAVAQNYKDAGCDFYFHRGLAGWNNKMFVRAEEMPHRIRITNVRVERLRDISDEDCMKEGVIHYDDVFGEGYMLAETYNNNYRRHCFTTPRKAFAYLIDKLSGKGTWENNPWVFVYDFELIK